MVLFIYSQSSSIQCLSLANVINNFRISVTFEMRTTEYSEIYISIDTHTIAERVYKGEDTVGKESKVAERQRERESVCASAARN
jgi:hypothetical protein